MRKPSLTTSTLTILSLILGTWLVFDATRKLLTGYYTGEQTIGLGPWATIVYALGVRPADMAFPFLFLGMIWIVNGVIILLGADTRYESRHRNLYRHTLLCATRDHCQYHHDTLVLEKKAPCRTVRKSLRDLILTLVLRPRKLTDSRINNGRI